MHVDAELLALLALDDRVGTAQEWAHVRTCAACTATLTRLQETGELARHATGVTLVAPSTRVWEAILDEVGRRTVRTASDGASARARLSPAGAAWSAASGDAEVSTDARGRRLLQLTLLADLPESGLRQAWLVDHDGRRQTLGVLDGPLGLWTLARAIDLAEFAVLEVTQQAVGSTEHSGDTIVSGQLVAVA